MEKRSSFSNRIGFVLAAAGSAVGLGNIWRFPYLAAKFGGGMFLIVYILLVMTFGFTIMISEIAIGRKTGQSAINAYGSLDKRFSFIGVITSVVPVIILPYYCVIGGWVIKYVITYLTGAQKNAVSDNFFGDFIAKPVEPIIWLLAFIAVTFIIVIVGVKNGIENSNKIMMPMLLVLILFVSIYALTLPGAMDGLIYYIKPNIKDFSVKTVLAALGQMFYSTSLAMGIMITYG
ncbi:MAG: sodium-dependent transporter, partial [Clostridia bacterium]|nr:sodium-dependent transporter [Clostridia bacterium]